MSKKNKKQRKGRRTRRRVAVAPANPISATADALELYEKSVQDAAIAVEMIDDFYASRSARPARVLREDFCGTAAICAAWVVTNPERIAVGLDIDRPTLDWGLSRNVVPLGEDANRVRLVERDVLCEAATEEHEPADVICAFNFSYCCFHERSRLLEYFTAARRGLADGGMLILDVQGGPDAQTALEEEKEFSGFTYVWEQGPYDPINNHHLCWIHFRFPDGSSLEKAFAYDWRLWTLPELRELLCEAGFSRVDTWWDGDDDVVAIVEKAENYESWIAYLAAWK